MVIDFIVERDRRRPELARGTNYVAIRARNEEVAEELAAIRQAILDEAFQQGYGLDDDALQNEVMRRFNRTAA